MDSTGQAAWQQDVILSPPSEYIRNISISLAADGDCYISWYQPSYYNQISIRVVKLNPQGEKIWQHEVEGVNNTSSSISPSLYGVLPDNQNGLYVVYHQKADTLDVIRLRHYTALGAEISPADTTVVAMPDHDVYYDDAIVTPDNGILIAYQVTHSSQDSNRCLRKLAPDYNTEWDHEITDGTQGEPCHDIRLYPLHTGQFALTFVSGWMAGIKKYNWDGVLLYENTILNSAIPLLFTTDDAGNVFFAAAMRLYKLTPDNEIVWQSVYFQDHYTPFYPIADNQGGCYNFERLYDGTGPDVLAEIQICYYNSNGDYSLIDTGITGLAPYPATVFHDNVLSFFWEGELIIKRVYTCKSAQPGETLWATFAMQ